MDAIWTIAPREPLRPTEPVLAAFLVDLHRYLIIDRRFTLISSPTAEVTGAGQYDFPDPPGADYVVSGPEMASGTVVRDWFSVPDRTRETLLERPATVHYDGGDLDMLLRAIPSAGIGTGDVFVLAWAGQSLDQVAHAVAVPALAGPTVHEPGEGSWYPYREDPVLDPADWDEDEEADEPGEDYGDDPSLREPGYLPAGAFWSHPVQTGLSTWASGGGTDHYVPPLADVLQRHLGADLLIASHVF
jgi:hypothetical protein